MTNDQNEKIAKDNTILKIKGSNDIDELEREEEVKIISNYIDNITENFVLLLNSKYGTGKTFFLKMLNENLSNKKNHVIYIDVWKSDNIHPLVVFMGELRKKYKNDAIDIFEKAKKISGSIFTSIFNNITGIDIDFKEIIDINFDKYESLINEKINFTKEMKKFRTDVVKDKKIVIIIDELDRCRPNYSIELLETINHFFEIDGFIFILAADKLQLSETVKSLYGNIDTKGYLRKFIDVEFTLTLPSNRKYFYFLLKKYNLSINDFYSEIIANIFEDSRLSFSLRDIEKVSIYLFNMILFKEFIMIKEFTMGVRLGKNTFLILFTIIKVNYPEIYEKHIINNNYNFEGLLEEKVMKIMIESISHLYSPKSPYDIIKNFLSSYKNSTGREKLFSWLNLKYYKLRIE